MHADPTFRQHLVRANEAARALACSRGWAGQVGKTVSTDCLPTHSGCDISLAACEGLCLAPPLTRMRRWPTTDTRCADRPAHLAFHLSRHDVHQLGCLRKYSIRLPASPPQDTVSTIYSQRTQAGARHVLLLRVPTSSPSVRCRPQVSSQPDCRLQVSARCPPCNRPRLTCAAYGLRTRCPPHVADRSPPRRAYYIAAGGPKQLAVKLLYGRSRAFTMAWSLAIYRGV